MMPTFRLVAFVGASLDFLLHNPLAFVFVVVASVAVAGLAILRLTRYGMELGVMEDRVRDLERFMRERQAYHRHDDGPTRAA
jgi:hypothetical protein